MTEKRLSERLAELLEAQLSPAVVRSLRRQGEVLMRHALAQAQAGNVERYAAILHAYMQQIKVLAAWKALAEHAEQGDSAGNIDEKIVRMLEMFNVKIMPPPHPEVFRLNAPQKDEPPF